MSNKLKEKLEEDLKEEVDVHMHPVDSSDGLFSFLTTDPDATCRLGKPKVYKIDLDGEPFFDWVMDGGNVAVVVSIHP